MTKPPIQKPRHEDQVKTALRIPRPLHEALSLAAEKNFRSLHAEMISRLDTTLLEELTKQNEEIKMLLRQILTHLRT